MQTFQVTLAGGGSQRVIGEQYNADPVSGLNIVDQFGNTTAQFAASAWTNIQVINPSQAVPASNGTLIVQGDGT